MDVCLSGVLVRIDLRVLLFNFAFAHGCLCVYVCPRCLCAWMCVFGHSASAPLIVALDALDGLGACLGTPEDKARQSDVRAPFSGWYTPSYGWLGLTGASCQ